MISSTETLVPGATELGEYTPYKYIKWPAVSQVEINHLVLNYAPPPSTNSIHFVG